jgi:hypothetical protein
MQIMVLGDADTWSTLEGCTILEVPDGLDIDQIQELLRGEDDSQITVVEEFDEVYIMNERLALYQLVQANMEEEIYRLQALVNEVRELLSRMDGSQEGDLAAMDEIMVRLDAALTPVR